MCCHVSIFGSDVIGALGNMARHSAKLCPQLLKAKVAESLLEAAHHDSQLGVQEVALVALRTLARHPPIRQVSSLSHLLSWQDL